MKTLILWKIAFITRPIYHPNDDSSNVKEIKISFMLIPFAFTTNTMPLFNLKKRIDFFQFLIKIKLCMCIAFPLCVLVFIIIFLHFRIIKIDDDDCQGKYMEKMRKCIVAAFAYISIYYYGKWARGHEKGSEFGA